MFKIITPVAAALAFAVSAAPAAAEEWTVEVPYGDLNLSSEAGVATLEARIRRAVHRVCGDFGSRDLQAVRDGRKCREAALLSANRQLAAALDKHNGVALATMQVKGTRG